MRLNLNGPINSLGYGVVSYNLWKNLRKKFDLTLWPIGGRIELPVEPDEELQKDIVGDHFNSKYNSLDKNTPCLKVWHEHSLAERIGKGVFSVLPFFEINKFDEKRKSHLSSADIIFVPSTWAKNIVRENLHLDSIVAPCGVDFDIFSPVPQNVNKCIFFNCGKWEYRKGHDILHKAFADAFSSNENVELWMMPANPFLTEHEKVLWEEKYKNDMRIKILPRVQFQQQVAQVMAQTYCGVFPARSEGWNLELLEMMAMGKKVIATDYSAHTEYCDSDNCKLIDIKEEEIAYDGKWFMGNVGTWASLDGDPYDQLVHHMRQAYREWSNNPFEQNENGIRTAKKFSWENMSDIISRVLQCKEANVC